MAVVVVVMVSSTRFGVAVVVEMLSSTGNGGGNDYKAALSCRGLRCQTYCYIIQGLRFRVRGVGIQK